MASRIALNLAGAATALVMVTGCVTGSDGRPSNQTMGTVLGAGLGGTVGGLAFGSAGGAIGGALVGALAGNLVGRALDDQERRRLAEATHRAFVAETNEPTVYTVEPTKPAASTTTAQAAPAKPATVVAAKPVGPKTTRTDGSSCRPIELTATKDGQTTTETTTFCQAAGSSDLKPVSV
ncbi:MAG TPA: glycine zipper domain-containing protein [Reyranella sp.]|nr:glycine zipper domain-containing protein [Reyranella sp.]